MNREMRRMLNKNTKDLVKTMEIMGVELNSEMFQNIQKPDKSPKKLLDVTRKLQEKTAQLEKLLMKSNEFNEKTNDMKINIK